MLNVSGAAEGFPLVEDTRILCADMAALGEICISSMVWAKDLATEHPEYADEMRKYYDWFLVPDPTTKRPLTSEERGLFAVPLSDVDPTAAFMDPTSMIVYPPTFQDPGLDIYRRYTAEDWLPPAEREKLDPNDPRSSLYGLTRSQPGLITTTPQRLEEHPLVEYQGTHFDQEDEYAHRVGIVLEGVRGSLLGTVSVHQIRGYVGSAIRTNAELRQHLIDRSEILDAMRVLHVPSQKGTVYKTSTRDVWHDGFSDFRGFSHDQMSPQFLSQLGQSSLIGFSRLASLPR